MASRRRARRLKNLARESHLQAWEAEDFEDPQSAQLEEDDPWTMPSVPESSLGREYGRERGSQETIPRAMADDCPQNHDLPEGQSATRHGHATSQPATPDTSVAFEPVQHKFDDFEFTEESAISSGPMAVQEQASDEWLNSLEPTTSQLNQPYDEQYHILLDHDDSTGSFDEFATPELDEPLPTAEYDGSRSTSLYSPDGGELDRWAIKVDEWLAKIDTSPSELQLVKKHLRSYTNARLGSWLAWASSKRWTGRLLVLFLQFEHYCHMHSHMWENFGGYGDPYALDGVISRDASYELVGNRSELPADRIIDPGWYSEWMRTAPRILIENGFRSFGSFAVYRSQSSDALIRDFTSEALARALTQYYYREWPDWLSHQDWYDLREWHDNLA